MKIAIKNFIVNKTTKVNLFRLPSIKYCSVNHLLPNVFVRIPSNILRQNLNLPTSTNITQLNQDIFALLINQFKKGYFVEIGANDGFTLSNTQYLEEHFKWKGLLIEPNQKYQKSLKNRYGSIVVSKAISNEEGSANFLDAGLYGGLEASMKDTHKDHTNCATKITVNCSTLNNILNDVDAPRNIDFISIDVEGGELAILEQIPGLDYRFKCGCIEHNHRKDDYNKMVKLLNKADYEVFWEHQSEHDLFFIDKKTENES